MAFIWAFDADGSLGLNGETAFVCAETGRTVSVSDSNLLATSAFATDDFVSPSAESEEKTIESITRRFSVIKIKAQFFEEDFEESTMMNPEEKEIFIRDPTAKEFLTCRHGIGAGHRIQQMFGEENSNESLIRTIQQYTRCGGDNGITEDYIRNACNLVKPSEKLYSCRKLTSRSFKSEF